MILSCFAMSFPSSPRYDYVSEAMVSITAADLEDGKTLTYTLAYDRSGLTLTLLTVTMAWPKCPMPLLRMISTKSRCISRATFNWRVLSVSMNNYSTLII